jgi:hypothetical protein
MKINDVIIPSINNIQRSDCPMPKYQIIQMGMGRCYAENLIAKEIVELENVGYYYEVVDE